MKEFNILFEQVGPAEWKRLIEHVQRAFEDKYWLDDGLQVESIDDFIIRVGGSDDKSSSESINELSSGHESNS